MAEIYVTSTADSGAGSLRQAIADAQDGDAILFDPLVFPAGETTTIYLSSVLNVAKNVTIDGGYIVRRTNFVVRDVEETPTEIEVDSENPPLTGEVVLFRITPRVALDGQSASRIISLSASEATFEKIGFKNGFSSAYGGAITINTGSNVSFFDCSFSACSASSGGGLCFTQGTSVVSLTACSVESCSSSLGGVAYAIGTSQLLVDGCSFYLNSTTTSHAGALRLDGTSVNTFANCVFSRNSAAVNGGVVYTVNACQNTFRNCKFERSTAANGGMIYASNSSTNYPTCTFSDCVFSDNSASTHGGALYLNAITRFTDCIFTGNIAGSNGGAIYSVGASQNAFTSCEFSGNTATTRGGSCYTSSTNLTAFDSCTFDNNDVFIYNTGNVAFSASSVAVLNIANSAVVEFSGGTTSVANLTLGSATVTIADGAALSITTSASVGSATISSPGRGLLGKAASVDISSATLTNITVFEIGAEVTSVSGTRIGKNYSFNIASSDNTKPVLIEYKGIEDLSWTIAEIAFYGAAYEISLDGDYSFRVFDGEAFHDVAFRVYGVYHEMAANVSVGYVKASAKVGAIKASGSVGYLQ